MNKWFRKGNSRRYHRVDMPVRFFLIPSSPIKDKDIYATGTDYFPPSLQRQIQAKKELTRQAVSRIQEQNEILTEIFEEMIQFIEFFGRCAVSISQGQSPKKDPQYWMSVKEHLKGFKTIVKIKASSPKTYQYLQMIEIKYLTFLKRMIYSINHSTPTHFEVEGDLPVGFKVDEMMTIFKSTKFSKIPLVQAILNLSEFMESYLEVYRQINADNYLKQYPQEWPLQIANVSASGIALLLNKKFEQYMRVDIHIYIESLDKVLDFDGSVVDIRTDESTQKERVAINFEFPEGHLQDILQLEIQKQEVKECMKFDLS
ncbi:MAG: PilZ domain-containing protein [Gammaproteobacteria bacterium]|nr:PilZ domain-containing protein [Gammaproteobacteria bacterium]